MLVLQLPSTRPSPTVAIVVAAIAIAIVAVATIAITIAVQLPAPEPPSNLVAPLLHLNGAVSAPMLGSVAHSRPDVEIRPLYANVICQNLGGFQPAQCVTLDL